MVEGTKSNLVLRDQMNNEKIIMVVVQLEQLQGTHGEARKVWASPKIHLWDVGEVQRCIHQCVGKKVTAKEWKVTLLNEILTSWTMLWQMKLVDEHVKYQGNPRG